MGIATVKKRVQHNADLAAVFHQMASCYRYLGAKHRFRVIAYDGRRKKVPAITWVKDYSCRIWSDEGGHIRH